MSVSDTSKIKVIGVAGGSASGKTTIVNIIREHFGDNLAVLSHDSYYKAHNELNYEERSRLNYDHPDSFETDMMVKHVRMLKKAYLWRYLFTITPSTTEARLQLSLNLRRLSLLRAYLFLRIRSFAMRWI